MTFGELMMLVGAFNQVQQALRWFIDNFSSIADWRATLLRVATFRNTLSTMDELSRNASPVELAEIEERPFGWTTSRSPPRLAASCRAGDVKLKPGERVLVLGDEAQEASLLRGVSKLWPWGVPEPGAARTMNVTVQGRKRHGADRLRAIDRIAPARVLVKEFVP
jgi:putative ATP-binding cassette transporter